MSPRYIGKCGNAFKTALRDDNGRFLTSLMWGDPAHVQAQAGDRVKVKARGQLGWVEAAALDDVSLLEVYVIDVGQGDGVLVKTPDDKWHLIDAGVSNNHQMTKKGAANFLRWKFQDDLLQPEVVLANVIVTHPDADHYGGLIDIFSGTLADGRTFPVTVEHFYHNGLGRFAVAPKLGLTQLGEVAPFPHGYHGVKRNGTFVTELFGGADSFRNPTRALDHSFASFAELVGSVPHSVQRLCREDGCLPGYGPGQNAVTITVLGPILEDLGAAQVGLRAFSDNDSKTVNGQSVLLRLDYGLARLLLTGDLNLPSQQLLLSYHDKAEFATDVFKACHHGSEDISEDFLKAVKARATVISSGDCESYSHPRPLIVGASGRYGREAVSIREEKLPPLVYSTELARSVQLDFAAAVRIRRQSDAIPLEDIGSEDVHLKAGDWKRFHSLAKTPLATDLVYGLVNIRTDGHHILCGTMLEKGSDFEVKVFRAGVDV